MTTQEVENGLGSVLFNLNTHGIPLWREPQIKILAEVLEQPLPSCIFSVLWIIISRKSSPRFSPPCTESALHWRDYSLQSHILSPQSCLWVEGYKEQNRKSDHSFLPHMVTCSLNLCLQFHTRVKAGDPMLLSPLLKQKVFLILCHYPTASTLV